MTIISALSRWQRVLPAVLLALVGLVSTGCEKEPFDDTYNVVGETGFTTIVTTGATKYAAGERVLLAVPYNANDNLQEISIFQVINRQDSAVVGTFPAAGVYNAPSQTLVQQLAYTVPANLANKTPVRVDVTLTFANGSRSLRRFTYNVAAPVTLKFGATPATYRNGLSATAQAAGDIIGYALVINEGGVGVLPTPPATTTSTLYKNVDSLAYGYVDDAGKSFRLGVVAAPSNGIATNRTVDVRVPAGQAGKTIRFVFYAYSQTQVTALTSAPLAVAAPTSFTGLKTGRVSFGPNSSPDSLAFNLKTGLNEPAANPVTAKDLLISNISGGAVSLSAANTTRYYKLPAATVATGYYNTATANAVGTLLFQNTTSADLGAVALNDVYAVRVRGTGEMMLLRITGVKPSTAGSTGRVKFEYRTL
ncbi:hypothetical protein [Hymenobacter swuensis]|uniref:Uncharacterized protein n=1 Tax=Hymenobacter swuensis DY53 TaxID=1227739 RepID=W8EXX2_9BACT|nr:hypothetical protein [Hymenobacter swuensis]AHJ96622.1 hypothetical protein Hsw_1027 [Hymenobacter swuensis DY53]